MTARRKSPSPAPGPCLLFQVHQPYRLSHYDFFRIGEHSTYEDEGLNREVFSRVAEKCYLPATKLFRELIEQSNGSFRFALSLTGVVLEQMEEFRPDVLEAFQELVETGAVELLGGTYYHSLASLYSWDEFQRQVALHREKIKALFGCNPRVFCNTELIYSNRIAREAERMGFAGVLGEAVPWLLWNQSANQLAQAPHVDRIKTFLRHPGLSDDLAFRFADETWVEYPVTADRYLGWIEKSGGDLVNIFMDFEIIGEHQGQETGIFRLWEDLVPLALQRGVEFLTPSEAVERFEAGFLYDCPSPSSWADQERDPSAWIGNIMQQEAALKLHAMEHAVIATQDDQLIDSWSKLQCSDHFHHMSTKGGTDGGVHCSFSPYGNPYDAYLYFMNALADLQIRIDRTGVGAGEKVA